MASHDYLKRSADREPLQNPRMGGSSHDLMIETGNAGQTNISTEEALEKEQILIILHSRKSYLFEYVSHSRSCREEFNQPQA